MREKEEEEGGVNDDSELGLEFGFGRGGLGGRKGEEQHGKQDHRAPTMATTKGMSDHSSQGTRYSW